MRRPIRKTRESVVTRVNTGKRNHSIEMKLNIDQPRGGPHTLLKRLPEDYVRKRESDDSENRIHRTASNVLEYVNLEWEWN